MSFRTLCLLCAFLLTAAPSRAQPVAAPAPAAPGAAVTPTPVVPAPGAPGATGAPGVAPVPAAVDPGAVPPAAPAQAPAAPALPPPAPVPFAPAVAPVEPAPALGSAPTTQLELSDIDERLAELYASRPGIGGPITLIAVGGGVALVSAYAALLNWAFAETDSDYDDPYDGDPYDDDYHNGREDRNRRTARVMFGVATLSLGASIGGIVWLSKRLHARRELKPEIDRLKIRRRELLRDVRYGFDTTGQSYGLSMSARF